MGHPYLDTPPLTFGKVCKDILASDLSDGLGRSPYFLLQFHEILLMIEVYIIL